MRLTIERLDERPGGRTATPLTLAAGHYPPEYPLARLVGRGAGALVRFIRGILAQWRCRRRRAAAICELMAWDDRMLKDIGLTRGEIIGAVDGRLDRDRPGRPAPTGDTGIAAPQGRQGTGRASVAFMPETGRPQVIGQRRADEFVCDSHAGVRKGAAR